MKRIVLVCFLLSLTIITKSQTVEATGATSITSTSATVNGTYTGTPLYFFNAEYSIDNFATTEGSIGATYSDNIASADLSGLDTGTVYYYRLLTYFSDFTYSNTVSFTTLSPPTVTTTEPNSINATGATLGGNVTNEGSADVTDRGICYSSENSNPTIENIKIQIGSGSGAYSQALTGLTTGTTYYAKAYAISDHGTSYGDAFEFTTVNVPTVSTNTATDITETQATLGGTVSDIGGSSLTERGVCYSSTNSNPEIGDTGVTKFIISGTETGSYENLVTGLSDDILYYFKAYAINSDGTGYGAVETFTTDAYPPIVTTTSASTILSDGATLGGEVTDEGSTSVTKTGICYSSINNDPEINGDDVTSVTIGAGSGLFSEVISTLTENTTYYFKAFAINTQDTSYGTVEIFTTLFPPIITTSSATNIEETQATLGGDISDIGGSALTERGVCYSSTNSNPEIDGTGVTKYEHTATTENIYSDIVTGLSDDVLYYFKAYAINTDGTGYGAVEEFTTLNLTMTWNGDIGTEWDNGDNWSAGTAPTELYDVTIPNVTNMPIITSSTNTSNTTISNATIAAGANLTITGGALTVTNEILLESPTGSGMPGTLIIPNESGSLSAGTSTIERYISTLNLSHYYCPPITSQTTGDFQSYWIGQFVEADTAWSYFSTLTDPLNAPKGYEIIRGSNGSQSLTFSGTFNNSDQSIALTNSGYATDLDDAGDAGWSLVGNPYPSTIDLGTSLGGPTMTNLDAAIYVYNASNTSYETYTTGSTSSIPIAPMQAFFVHVSGSSTGTFGVSNSLRSSTSVAFKSSKQTTKQYVNLKITNNYYSTKTEISFYDGATSNFDTKFDGYKLFAADWQRNDTVPEIYTIINDDIKSSINTYPIETLNNITSEGVIFKLGVKYELSSALTISIDNMENIPSDVNMILIDNFTGQEINLFESNYSFLPDTLSDERFEIHFYKKTINVESISIINSSGTDSMQLNSQLQLRTEITPSNATDSTVTWLSNNEDIAVVNESGLVTSKDYGEVTITAKSNDGTEIEKSLTLTVYSSTDIDEDSGINFAKIYPNPSSEKVTFESSEKECSYKIYSSSGKLIKSDELSGKSTINISSFDEGAYYIEFISENKRQTELLIKL